MDLLSVCLFCNCDTRGGCRSFFASPSQAVESYRQTGRQTERLTYLHLRKSSHPSADGLICNSISHNVISLAFTHLADKGNQARCLMKYRLGLLEDLNVPPTPLSLSLSFSLFLSSHTHARTHANPSIESE